MNLRNIRSEWFLKIKMFDFFVSFAFVLNFIGWVMAAGILSLWIYPLFVLSCWMSEFTEKKYRGSQFALNKIHEEAMDTLKRFVILIILIVSYKCLYRLQERALFCICNKMKRI